MTIYTQANPGVFLPHMPDVARCELSLRELNQMWRLIESSAKMNCPAEARLLLPAMVATRTGFAHLEQALVANLVQEKVRHVLAELGTQARYAIDILVRNLYERTADVGFLAADADLCRIVAGLADDQDAARRRLHDYRDKYTVYDEILLLDLEGRVLVQADPTLPLTHSRDPLLQQTLDTPGYLETFRATDLRPGKPRALVYSQRMLHPGSGAPVGVLCLCFNFDDEMAAIFAAYRDPSQRANMLLLDAQDRVISSADPLWIPAGVRVPTNTAGQPQLLLFGGREYLVRTFGAAGYQGYPGPAGWKTQLMIPVDLAFRAGSEQALAAVAPALMQGLLSHAQAFSPALHELMGSVTRTTRTIERIVWNGKVTGAAHERDQGQDHADTGQRDGVNKLNTVLDQITETGQRSDALFSHSIQDLYQTVLASSLSEASLTAQLLVDLLDRNLYERANDCRWWAQSAQLRRGLAWPSAAENAAIGAVLAHINRLYTVYARLFVYDRDGRIVASTGDDTLVGQQLDGDTLARVTALRSAQAHHPQAFGPSPFYGGDATYVYHAAIRHPEQDTVVGGIGVVFDARPELRNMLHSGVAGRAHLRAYFVTPDGRVLSSSDADCDAGDLLQLDGGLLAAAAEGDSGAASRILQHDGQYVIAACARAAGYREFRAVDGVEQPVLAVLLQAFGPVRGAPPAPTPRIERLRDSGPDFAIFYAGGTLMALRAAHVQEALPFARVQRTPSGDSGGGGSAGAGGSSGGSGGAGDSGSGSARQARIGMLDVAPAGGRAHCVWVFDLALLAGGRAAAISEHSQVMLVRHGATLLGLLVDDLHSVQQFDAADLSASPLAVGDAALAPRLIKANDGQLLIQELDLERLLARLRT